MRLLSLIIPLIPLLAGFLPGFPAAFAEDGYPQAVYTLMAASQHGQPPVDSLEITAGPREDWKGASMQWWELRIIKDATSGLSFRCQFLGDQIPLYNDGGSPARIARYLLEEPDYPPLEWVDAETGEALLPRYQFLKNFVPQPARASTAIDGFAPAGTCIGHALTLKTTRRISADSWKPIQAKRLVMNRYLLIGTGRAFKDDGTGRYPDPDKAIEYPKGEYRYIKWTEDDVENLITAGHNYFGFEHLPLKRFYDYPVFYRAQPDPKHFPEEFYRSNYMGPHMFIDEPAVLSGGAIARSNIQHLDAAPNFMTNYVATEINRAMGTVRRILEGAKIPLGTLDLTDYDIPSWDTYNETAFYQFYANVSGLCHEGRYVLKEHNEWYAHIFGTPLEMTRDEMLHNVYALMRGPARSFNKSWGTAVYGQMEPESRLPCLTKAYDMGARYLWFWTSDHDHHVPFTEQIEISRALQKHIQAHPRKSTQEAKRSASVAIALPWGYMLTAGPIWWQPIFRQDALNVAGVPNREILAAAVWEGIMCRRNGEDFDFVIDAEGFDPSGYKRVVRVKMDGSVENGTPFQAPESLQIVLREDKTASAGIQCPTAHTVISPITPVIDGDLGDWKDAHWMEAKRIWSATTMNEGISRPPQDLSARAALAGDLNNLYIAVEVKDDRHYQTDENSWFWRHDSVQMAFDPFRDGGYNQYHEDDLEIGFALSPRGPMAWRWEGALAGPPGEMKNLSLQIRRDDINGLTLYEAAIPLAELVPLDFLMARVIGVDFAVNDSDGGFRDCFVQWTPGLAEKKAPTLFGTAQWDRPSAKTDLPLRAWGKVTSAAGVVGDPWSFELRTSGWNGRKGSVEVTLADNDHHDVSATKSLTFRNDQRFQVRIPTRDIAPGRYDLTYQIRSEEGLVFERRYKAYLVPPPMK